ncbi:MAG TPA: lantibiotic dehydratase, partial [Gemmatimonadaceae bacterium]|nr:lantibiotic dehydratase [Gemmatimonadaceae bacterium]
NVGYGKYFSRFLYLLPQRCREEVVADNESLSDDLLAEICGDAAFNANLHPPLLPWEISYPTGQHAGSAQQLLSADIVVRQDPENQHALLLVHAPTGRRVLPVDLGFMSVQLRPPLYQLLARFSPCGYFAFPLPQSLHVPIPGTPPQLKATNVLCRPRITYEGTVVLARRCWMVPPGFFPIQTRDESDADFFVRVLRWRNLHGVPERAYVRVLPLFDTPETKQPAAALAADTANLQATEPVVRAEESEQHDDVNHEEDEVGGQREVSENDAPNTGPNAVARHPSRDWRKPQFIDFANPLLVRLFARLTSGLKRFSVVLEECLPTAEQLPRSDGAAYAVELVLQFGFPDGIETGANGLA